jgi:hypothetical protein
VAGRCHHTHTATAGSVIFASAPLPSRLMVYAEDTAKADGRGTDGTGT